MKEFFMKVSEQLNLVRGKRRVCSALRLKLGMSWYSSKLLASYLTADMLAASGVF